MLASSVHPSRPSFFFFTIPRPWPVFESLGNEFYRVFLPRFRRTRCLRRTFPSFTRLARCRINRANWILVRLFVQLFEIEDLGETWERKMSNERHGAKSIKGSQYFMLLSLSGNRFWRQYPAFFHDHHFFSSSGPSVTGHLLNVAPGATTCRPERKRSQRGQQRKGTPPVREPSIRLVSKVASPPPTDRGSATMRLARWLSCQLPTGWPLVELGPPPSPRVLFVFIPFFFCVFTAFQLLFLGFTGFFLVSLSFFISFIKFFTDLGGHSCNLALHPLHPSCLFSFPFFSAFLPDFSCSSLVLLGFSWYRSVSFLVSLISSWTLLGFSWFCWLQLSFPWFEKFYWTIL